jgi:truncated hemoglobin YjbI
MSTINHSIANSFSSQQAQQLNLYEMLGGAPIIEAAVEEVSRRMVNDTCLRFFANKQDLASGKDYLTQFFTIALIHGIPKDTSKVDEAIVDKMQRLFILGLNEQHFDLTLGHLVLTLESFGVNRSMVIEVARNLIPLRTAFVDGAKKARSRQAGARFSLSL